MDTLLKEMDTKINAISEMVTKILDNQLKQSTITSIMPVVRLTIRSIKDVSGVTGNIKLVRGTDENNQWFSFFIKEAMFEIGNSVTVQYNKKEFNEKYNTMNLKGIKVLSGE